MTSSDEIRLSVLETMSDRPKDIASIMLQLPWDFEDTKLAVEELWSEGLLDKDSIGIYRITASGRRRLRAGGA